MLRSLLTQDLKAAGALSKEEAVTRKRHMALCAPLSDHQKARCPMPESAESAVKMVLARYI